MLAAFTKTPELALNDDEAKTLAHGISEVNRHYPMPVSPGHVAIGALITAAVSIYRPKLREVSERKARERNPAPSAEEASPFVRPVVNAGLTMPTATETPVPWFGPPGTQH